MNQKIKFSYVLILLLFFFFGSVTFIDWATKQIDLAFYIPEAKNQLAQVGSAPSNGLVIHYPFDDGTVSGAPVGGKAKAFAGSSDKVSLNDVIDTGTVTVCAWIYPTSANGEHAIVSNARFSLGTYLINNRIHLTSTSGVGLLSTTALLVENQWQHVCGIRSAGTGGVGSIYINGVLNVSGDTGTPVAGYGLAIGDSGVNDRPWNGSIDDVRIYNRALSSDEILQLYSLGASSVATTPPPQPPPPSPPIDTTPSAQTTTASSCSQTDVQYAVDHTDGNGTVFVPAGDCSWSGTVVIPSSKRLRIFGAGKDLTTLRMTSQWGTIFDMGTSGSRISGFTFILQHQNSLAIKVQGSNWRIDHNRFDVNHPDPNLYPNSVHATSEVKGAIPYGVMDHNEFKRSIILVTSSNILDHSLWYSSLGLGTEKAVYIEDSTFELIGFGESIDANYGGKFVLRYNTIINAEIDAHSVQGGGRATRSWEIYNNIIQQKNIDQSVPARLRGGTGVIFNNTLIGNWTHPEFYFDNVRDEDRFPSGVTSVVNQGRCDGGSLWDGNQPLANGGSGTHTGATGALVLSDSAKSWGAGALVGNWVWNLTKGTRGRITANTSTTITTIAIDPSNGAPSGVSNLWTNGDQYKVTDGYPCRDQIGRSQDQSLWTTSSPFPPQNLEPVYIWNNKRNGVEVGAFAGGPHILAGRDYIVGTPRPGYTPYTYPHPLTKSGFTGDDPTQPLPPPPLPAPSLPQPVVGSCSATLNFCTVGTFVDLADNTTNKLWQCVGSNGGATAQCSIPLSQTLSPVDGVCSATPNSCSAGTFVDLTDTATSKLWSCTGLNGGTTAQCSVSVAPPAPPLSGLCSNVLNSCSSGVFFDLADTITNKFWACIGESGGTTAQCSLAVTPPAPATNGLCSATVTNECTSGTFLNVADTATNSLWNCVGSNGGTTAQCSVSVSSGSSDIASPALSAISASSITDSSAKISWVTNEPSSTQVEYGPTSSYGNMNGLVTTLVTVHSQFLTNLEPNTVYHYRVMSKDEAGNLAVSNDGTFSTLSSSEPVQAVPAVNKPPENTPAQAPSLQAPAASQVIQIDILTSPKTSVAPSVVQTNVPTPIPSSGSGSRSSNRTPSVSSAQTFASSSFDFSSASDNIFGITSDTSLFSDIFTILRYLYLRISDGLMEIVETELN